MLETISSYYSLLLFFFLFLFAVKISAVGVLEQGQNLTDGKTIVSDGGGSFTLGFFSPGSSTKRYLGIWFSVSSDAVCWVANRDRPLKDSSGVLVVGVTGSLLLLDGSGQVVWSSNSPNTSSVEARLGDNGNLVVLDRSSGTNLWQSFDHPSDTVLPGMKLGKNLWTGGEWFLTSWRSADDPSPGSYRRTLDTNGLPQIVLWQGNVTTYRTGPWNGQFFNGVPEAASYVSSFPLQVTASPGEITYMFTAKAGAPLTRVVVNYTGVVQRLVWVASSRSWETYFRGPRDICDAYAKCGAFGLCDANAVAAAFCSCLKGFSPVSPAAWSMRETSRGCRRNVAPDCGNSATTDGFTVIRGVKLPDTNNASVDTSISVDECRARCLANCSCLAYAAAYIQGGGCVIWTDAIVDVRYIDKGQDLYLRLAKSELDEIRRQKFPIVAVVAPVACTVIILSFLFVLWWRRHRNSDTIPQNPTMAVPSVDISTIRKATENFSEGNMIGQGGFGIVYKGQVPDRRTIAVKRLKQSALSSKGRSDFTREVEVMARLRHGNLVKLLAYCNDGNERILIYEYIQNKSLDVYIFGEPNLRAMLNWRKRLDIIQGIAQGVAYLHEWSGESIIHRDLKPSNVLLDNNWRPKIADFATAKLFVADQTVSNMTIVVSPGYASSEYAEKGEMTLKCDVYSFGVILLETLSGERNGAMQRLLSHAWGLWEQDRTMAILDPAVDVSSSMPDSEISSELERCIQVGMLCVQESPDDRPAMSAVVAMLTSKNSQVDWPNSPGICNMTRPASRQSDLTSPSTIDLT